MRKLVVVLICFFVFSCAKKKTYVCNVKYDNGGGNLITVECVNEPYLKNGGLYADGEIVAFEVSNVFFKKGGESE